MEITGDRRRQLSMASRRELTAAVAMRYQRSTRKQKKSILDEFTEVRRFHRKHANRVLPVKSPHLGELVKNALLLLPCAPLIAHRYRCSQFAPAGHAQLPPPVARYFHTKRVTFS